MVITGEEKYFDGLRERTCRVGKCDCGEEIWLICRPPLYACECVCGRYYNSAGDELNLPNEWEEDLEEYW